MITEQSLRAALLEEARDAAPVDLDAVIAAQAGRGDAADSDRAVVVVQEHLTSSAGGRRPRRRPRARYAAVAVGTVAAAAVVAVTAAVLATHENRATTAPAAASGRSTGFDPVYWNTVQATPGLVVGSRTLLADRQSVVFSTQTATATGLQSQQVGRVDLYAAGTFDATSVQAGTEEKVGGKTAYRASIPVQEFDGAPDTTKTLPVIAWQWADDSWAVAAGLDSPHQTVDAEVLLAETIVPGPTPVLLPARFEALPAGLVRTSLTIDESLPALQTYTATFARVGAVAEPGSLIAADYTLMMTLADANMTSAMPPDDALPSSDPTNPVLQSGLVAGGVAYAVSSVHLQDFTTLYVTATGSSPLAIQLSVNDRLSRTVDPRWAQFTPATSWTDRTTWSNAAKALP